MAIDIEYQNSLGEIVLSENVEIIIKGNKEISFEYIEMIISKSLQDPNIIKDYNTPIKKIIIVPDKLINFVTY